MTPQREKDIALTAAFMMEGLRDCDYKNVIDAYSDDGGLIELVREILMYVPELVDIIEEQIEQRQYGFPGVFEYEVTSYFGKWFGDYLLDVGTIPTRTECMEWIENETKQFFAQGEIPA